MARVTIEDCLRVVPNRFHVVAIATKRARAISQNESEPLVPLENDKPTVLALREMADRLITTDIPVFEDKITEYSIDAELAADLAATEEGEAITEEATEATDTIVTTDESAEAVTEEAIEVATEVIEEATEAEVIAAAEDTTEEDVTAESADDEPTPVEDTAESDEIATDDNTDTESE